MGESVHSNILVEEASDKILLISQSNDAMVAKIYPRKVMVPLSISQILLGTLIIALQVRIHLGLFLKPFINTWSTLSLKVGLLGLGAKFYGAEDKHATSTIWIGSAFIVVGLLGLSASKYPSYDL